MEKTKKLLVGALAALPFLAHGEILDRVAAVVNGRIITLSEVRERAALELARADALDDAGRGEARRKAYRAALDALVTEKLIEAQVQESQIEVSAEEVDEAIDNVRRQNNLTPAQLTEAVEAQGMSMARYREQMKGVLQRQKLLTMRIRARVKVTDDDVKSYYARLVAGLSGDEEIHAQHILLLWPKDAPEAKVAEVMARARDLAARARKGEDFAALARRESEGPTAGDGGDLGWFKRGTMVEEFERVAFSLQKGQISDPVRTGYGVHVIKLLDRRVASALPLSQVEDRIREQLFREELERQTENYLAQLKKSATITYKVDVQRLGDDEG